MISKRRGKASSRYSTNLNCMTVTYGPLIGLSGSVTAVMVLGELGITNRWAGYAALLVGFFIAVFAWMYSPLPNTNGGIASSDPLRGRYWGLYPAGRWRAPNQVSRHESEPRAIYYYDQDCVAVDIGEGVVAEGETPDDAVNQLQRAMS